MPPVETLSYVGVMAVMLFIMWKGYNKITNNHNRDIEKLKQEHKEELSKVNAQCAKIQKRLVVMETKQDIYLTELGFDVHEVNTAIKEHMEELENNEKPSIGCLEIGKLRRQREQR